MKRKGAKEMEFNYIIYMSLFFAYIVAVISVALVVVLENRQPVKTVSWLLVISSFPIVGLILYAFFGRNIRRSVLVSRACRTQLARRSAHKFYRSDTPEIPEGQHHLVSLFRRQSAAFPFADNRVDVFTSGSCLLSQMLDDMRAARHHIHIEFYIFEDDEVGHEVRKCLMEKAEQGVEIRVVYDDVGCWNVPARFYNKMKKAGVEVFGFLPVRFPTLTRKVNYRNHRKIVVIDGKVGYVGGFNLADRYFKDSGKKRAWRDTHLRLQGNAVLGLQRAFLADWHVASGRMVSDEKYFPVDMIASREGEVHGAAVSGFGAVVQIVTAIPTGKRFDIMQGLVLMLMRAKSYCYIQSPYFIPTDRVLYALQTAALAGVDVRIMLPECADKKILAWASYSYLSDVMRAGVRVYLYQPAFLHSKMWVSDDAVLSCGSTNIDFRSFEHNFEINAFVYNTGIARKMRAQFIDDQQNCRLLNLERWVTRSAWQRIGTSLVRLFTPLL